MTEINSCVLFFVKYVHEIQMQLLHGILTFNCCQGVAAGRKADNDKDTNRRADK